MDETSEIVVAYTPSVFVAMAAVLDELPGIGKDQFNQQQGFKFRGVDDVMRELNPLLGKHGVFFMPNVWERIEEKRTTNKGTVMHAVHLHVKYTFYGPAGDSVTASAWGEGTDMGDKATPKAMTNAMKNCLFQVFAVADSDTDGDHGTPADTVSTINTVQHAELVAALDRLGHYPQVWKDRAFPQRSDLTRLPADLYDEALSILQGSVPGPPAGTGTRDGGSVTEATSPSALPPPEPPVTGPCAECGRGDTKKLPPTSDGRLLCKDRAGCAKRVTELEAPFTEATP